jgi:hypothetical protein
VHGHDGAPREGKPWFARVEVPAASVHRTQPEVPKDFLTFKSSLCDSRFKERDCNRDLIAFRQTFFCDRRINLASQRLDNSST